MAEKRKRASHEEPVSGEPSRVEATTAGAPDVSSEPHMPVNSPDATVEHGSTLERLPFFDRHAGAGPGGWQRQGVIALSETTRTIAVVALLAAAAWSWQPAGVLPDPTPDDPRLTLRGLFVGERAADDAATLSAFAGAISDAIEEDGKSSEPLLRTGVQFDTLRVRAREILCRGERIGDRQPKVRDAIHSYLDSALGTAGGPVDAAQRAKWVEAYRVIAGAAANATR